MQIWRGIWLCSFATVHIKTVLYYKKRKRKLTAHSGNEVSNSCRLWLNTPPMKETPQRAWKTLILNYNLSSYDVLMPNKVWHSTITPVVSRGTLSSYTTLNSRLELFKAQTLCSRTRESCPGLGHHNIIPLFTQYCLHHHTQTPSIHPSVSIISPPPILHIRFAVPLW